MYIRLLVILFLAFAVISSTGCGEEPAPIAPKADIPLSTVGADGETAPAPPPAAPATEAPAATEEPETEEGE